MDGSYDEAAAAAAAAERDEGLTLVHAFDDPVVLAGQGTIGLEIAEQAPRTRLVVVSIGGGALAAGVAIAVKDRLPGVRVVGVQSDRCAPYPDSLAARQPIGARAVSTICDGIAVKRPGELTLPLVSEYVDEIVTVSDDDVAQAMVLLLERSKLVVEGAGAASVAALLAGKVEPPARRRRVRAALRRQRRRRAAGRVHPSRRDRLGPPAGVLHRGPGPARRARPARRHGRRAAGERARRRPPTRGSRPARARDRDPARAADRRPRAWRAGAGGGARAGLRGDLAGVAVDRARGPGRRGPGRPRARRRARGGGRPSPPLRRLVAAEGQARARARRGRTRPCARSRRRPGCAASSGASSIRSRYRDRKGRAKLVRWWQMRPIGGDFEPNDEVDELRWERRRTLRSALLDYDHDRDLVRSALGGAWGRINVQVAGAPARASGMSADSDRGDARSATARTPVAPITPIRTQRRGRKATPRGHLRCQSRGAVGAPALFWSLKSCPPADR